MCYNQLFKSYQRLGLRSPPLTSSSARKVWHHFFSLKNLIIGAHSHKDLLLAILDFSPPSKLSDSLLFYERKVRLNYLSIKNLLSSRISSHIRLIKFRSMVVHRKDALVYIPYFLLMWQCMSVIQVATDVRAYNSSCTVVS